MKKRTRKLTLNRETLMTLARVGTMAPGGVLVQEDWRDKITVSGCTCAETGCGEPPTYTA